MRRFLIALTLLSSVLPAPLQAATASPSPQPTPSSLPSTLPDDPYFPKQWALHNDGTQTVDIDVDDLHTIHQQGVAGVDIGWADSLAALSKLGAAPVIVAVIDSGIDPTHPELQGRISPAGWDFLGRTPKLSDSMGHGTHVSGIIAANADNAQGIAGIAPPSVQIMPLRVVSQSFQNFAFRGELISDYVADAVNYAVSHGAQIINICISWPEIADTPNARLAFQNAIQKGVLIVVAAGNDRKDAPSYPCAYEGVVCVGSLTNTGAMALYSNYGGLVDLLAPGDGIISLYPLNVDSETLRIQGYEMLSGTSQAAPMVTGVAAALKSYLPDLSLAELKARLFVSAAGVPCVGISQSPSLGSHASTSVCGVGASTGVPGALYGGVHLLRAYQAKPEPVFVPDFKGMSEITVPEASGSNAALTVQGQLNIQNLWLAASGVSAQVSVNGVPAGSASAQALAGGAVLSVPWRYQFASLDASSNLVFSVTITDASGDLRQFSTEVAAMRAMDQMPGTLNIPVPAPSPSSLPVWVGSSNGHLFANLAMVQDYPRMPGPPGYYQQIRSSTGTTLQIFDPQSSQKLITVQVPNVLEVTQLIKIDVDGDGTPDWVAIGLGQTAANQVFLQFYYFDSNFKPLWGNASALQLPGTAALSKTALYLDYATQAPSHFRDFSVPGSWVRGAQGHLVPAFNAQGQLPVKDDFDELDPRHGQVAAHAYYLSEVAAPPAPGPSPSPVALEVRAIDSATLRANWDPTAHLQNLAPGTPDDQRAGRLDLLLVAGDAMEGRTSVFDVRAVNNTSVTAAPGWDALSSGGTPATALPGDEAAFSGLYDSARGIITWATPEGGFIDSAEFSFENPEDPFIGLVGAFDWPSEGRFWFMQSGFDLVGYHQAGAGQAVESLSIPIERDSSFADDEFSEMLTPVAVGTAAQPRAGIYLDSTLVRGDRVAVAIWDPGTSSLLKPLRYSLQVPSGCVQMNPVHLTDDPASFAVPLVCQAANQLELRLVRPTFAGN